MTSSITEQLALDHDRCDRLFANIEAAIADHDVGRTQTAFADFQQAMLRHLATEEAILFPAFEMIDAADLGLTHRMRLEHEQIRDLLEQLQAGLLAEKQQACAGLLPVLAELVQQHNLAEEELLYPIMDRTLGEKGAELLRQIESLKD